MANHGPSYGFSREIQLKNQARFVLEEAQETMNWIQQCTGIQFETDPFQMQEEREIGNTLKDGIQLCTLANILTGGTVKFNKNAKMPFHQMENISNFLEAIKKYGVPEISCFQTVDLYERKALYKVFECLRSLAAVAQKKKAPVPIPSWVVRMSAENPRSFDEETLKQGETVISLQMGTNKGASQSGMTPYGAPRQIMPDQPK